MVKMKIEYEGQLHCRLTHEPSGRQIDTDAPKDNNGKGEAFSPTDLVTAALGACMLTIMGIVANKNQIDISGARVDVVKEMVASPHRRIGAILYHVHMPKGIAASQRQMLEDAAHSCPVIKSLHPDIKVQGNFVWE